MNKPIKKITGILPTGITALEPICISRNGKSLWKALCFCGKEFTASSDHLTRKKQPLKSCGCRRVESGPRHHQWTGYGGISGGWFYDHVSKERDQKVRARVPVDVDAKYVWELYQKQDGKCALSGVTLNISTSPVLNTASIDRIDSSQGYIPGNIQWVHKVINFMKRTYTQKYFIEMCQLVAAHSGAKHEI